MQFSSFVSKVVSFVLAVLTAVFNLFPSDLLGLGDKETPAVLEKAGGFIAGVCHPEPQIDLIKDAGIGWIRVDIPYPFQPDGTVNPYYEYWKAAAAEYAANGVKIFAVTPYPYYYMECGLDIRNEEDVEGIREIARFFAEDLQGVVGAFQITNEMGVDRFTDPLTMEEAAKFIGVQMEAMAEVKGDILVGYNLGGLGLFRLPFLMNAYKDVTDYVGVDLYLGSFENVTRHIGLNYVALNLVRLVTGKPIIMTEFGYLGYGEPKTKEEKTAILQSYGFDSEEDVLSDVDTFISRLPEKLREEFTRLYGALGPEEKWTLLFKGEYANHIYRELSEGTGLYNCPHTPEGQAVFYAKVLTRLQKISWCAGAIIYMWHDTESCYVCGQSDCPVETGWGIVDGEGNPKPAYYAVKWALTGRGNE